MNLTSQNSFPLESAYLISVISVISGGFRCVFIAVFALFSLVYPHYTVKLLSKVLSKNKNLKEFTNCDIFFQYIHLI